MPITITIPTNGAVGPGAFLNLASNVQGPPAVGFIFVVDVIPLDVGAEQGWIKHQVGSNSQQLSIMLQDPYGGWTYTKEENTPTVGGQVRLNVTLQDGQQVIDQGTVDVPWQTEPFASQWQWYLAQKFQSQGLTNEQAQQLQQASDNSQTALENWQQYETVTLPSLQDMLNNIIGGVTATVTTATGAVSSTLGQIFSGKTLDTLTSEVLAAACYPESIDHLLVPALWYGVQVNLTAVPDYVAWTAPGENWTPQDLAVLTISRGGDQVYRVGVHTRRVEVYPLPGVPLVPMELDLPVTPPDYRIQVAFAAGVCGELVGLYLP